MTVDAAVSAILQALYAAGYLTLPEVTQPSLATETI
jgi:hypothetical protein